MSVFFAALFGGCAGYLIVTLAQAGMITEAVVAFLVWLSGFAWATLAAFNR